MARSSTRDRALSEEVIVKAALGIIRRKGVAALTMRDLADVLGVSPMAAYHYVDGKDDLIRLVGNHVWGSVAVAPPGAGPWYERLRSVLIAERDATKHYRGLYEAVLYLDVEQKRKLEDAELDLLLEAGYPPALALPAYRVLMSWVSGYASIESAMRDPKRRRPAAHWGKAQRLSLDRDQTPEIPADDYFRFGVDAVIVGLRASLDA
jgi:AcrR family transcriptional regulator